MKRWQVLLITAIAVGLVSRGVATPDPATTPTAALTPEAIGAIIGSVNPHLSAAERQRIGRAILRSSRDYTLDPQLVTAIILVESGARPWALSAKGADSVCMRLDGTRASYRAHSAIRLYGRLASR